MSRPEVRLYRTGGAFHFGAFGDVRDDAFEAFLQWCDDRDIRLGDDHNFEEPRRRYFSLGTVTADHAFEMRLAWAFVTFVDRGATW
jgi:hypothetical protein